MNPDPIHRKLLVTGHPRCGTGYMANLCQSCGWDVGHEHLGDDGVSSWMMAPPVWRVVFHRRWEHKGRNWFTFDRTIEVVREPLSAIASVAFTENRGRYDASASLWWRAIWTPIDLADSADTVTQAVQSIVGWHQMIRQWIPDAITVRLEDATADLPPLLGDVRPADPGVVNAREHQRLTWDDVRAKCDDRLWVALMQHTAELGYRGP